jgi:hypothetical protein
MRTRNALRECRSAVSGKDSRQKSPWTAVPDGGSDHRRMLLPPATRGGLRPRLWRVFCDASWRNAVLFFRYAVGWFLCSNNGGVSAWEIGGSCPQSAAITPKAHDSGCRTANCNRAQQVMAIDDSLNSRMHRPSPVYRPVRVPQDLSAQ